MLPLKTRHLLYAALLLGLSIIGTTAIANTSVYEIFWASEASDSQTDEAVSAGETVTLEYNFFIFWGKQCPHVYDYYPGGK